MIQPLGAHVDRNGAHVDYRFGVSLHRWSAVVPPDQTAEYRMSGELIKLRTSFVSHPVRVPSFNHQKER